MIMVRIVRRLLAVVVLAFVPLLAAGPADVAGNPYTPIEVCGSAFTKTVASFDVNGVARTYLLRRPNGNWCVVTMKYRLLDLKTYVGAAIGRHHTDWATDRDYGAFYYYAGPVRSSDACVFFAGMTGPDAPISSPGTPWIVRAPYPSSCT